MRIALVDPSRAVRRAMMQLIEGSGHEVAPFADGLQALDYITQDEDVRALITSTQPINISGIELCSAARKLSGSRRALHVVLMSSTDDYYLAVTALDNGADDFIHKPPIAEELRARLRLADRVTSMKRQLIEYATLDSLTGVLNRRAFFETAIERHQAPASKIECSAAIFDIDHFKQVNDLYGHEIGDRVLAAVGAEAKRAGSIVGRLGGEEFCLIEDGELSVGLERASKLADSIRALRFDHDGETFRITCSFGVAGWMEGDTIDRVLRRADMAMYQAKRTGRDRIVCSDSLPLEPDATDACPVTRRERA